MTTQANVDLASFVGTWQLNTERTSVDFRTRAAWIIPAKGSLQAIRGNALVGADGGVSGEIVIDPASVDTKTKKRDDHLRSADYFDIAHYPTITVTVTEVHPALSGDLEVVGILDVHGRSTSLTLLANVDLEGESATLSTEVVITRSMLGMKKTTPAKSWVTVHAHFDRARP
jgi:polyisoprenoid-binding protein YceI